MLVLSSQPKSMLGNQHAVGADAQLPVAVHGVRVVDRQARRRGDQVAPALEFVIFFVDEQDLPVAVDDLEADAPARARRQAKLDEGLNIVDVVEHRARPVDDRLLIAAERHHADVSRQDVRFGRVKPGAAHGVERVRVDLIGARLRGHDSSSSSIGIARRKAGVAFDCGRTGAPADTSRGLPAPAVKT